MGTGESIALVVIAALTVVTAVGLAIRERTARRVADRAVAAGATRASIAEADAADARRIGDDALELIDGLGVGVVRLDGRLVVTAANDAALALLDRDGERVVGHPAFEAFADQRLLDLVTSAASEGSALGELSRGGPDASRIVARARLARSEGLWLMLEDVSELRRLQRIRTEFIDNLSHELRTPLTSLGLLAETLARDVEMAADAGGPVTSKMRERIGKIQLETSHLTQMVTEMLELSRIEAGGSPEPGLLEMVDLGRVAAVSTERLRTYADRSGVRLRVELAEVSLPPVRGDEDRLGQVLLNLVHNAVKFSPNGGAVVVRVEAVGPEVVTAVADQGRGIPVAAQARIFERFYKVDRARVRGQGGTGLGLAIARHIVEAHGGRIWVESSEGNGSVFRFAIPALVDARAPVLAVGRP